MKNLSGSRISAQSPASEYGAMAGAGRCGDEHRAGE